MVKAHVFAASERAETGIYYLAAFGIVFCYDVIKTELCELRVARPAEPVLSHRRVFLAPPWPEIYETDPERRHGLDVAAAEYSHLLETYPSLGYEVLLLPEVRVSERADFILNTLEA